MQTKSTLIFVAVTIIVGSIVCMTTSDVFATQTGNPSNSNTDTGSNDSPENNSAGDDADEAGDIDANDDEEDTDTGNEDVGEANDDEGEEGSDSTASVSTSTNDNLAGVPEPPAFDPRNFGNEIINNPYFTLTPGTTFTYQTETEDGTEKDMVIVTNETKEILGITTTVVWDRVWLDEELTEETFDWHAQDKQGTVWYMGEDSKEYENGEVVSTEGSWEAGVDGAQPGIIMEADPQVGDSYRQEYYPGHAEDAAKVVSLGEEVTVPFGTFTDCLQTRDVSLLEPNQDEDKYYCKDVGGVVLEVAVDSGERTELNDFHQGGNSSSTEPISTINNAATNDTDE